MVGTPIGAAIGAGVGALIGGGAGFIAGSGWRGGGWSGSSSQGEANHTHMHCGRYLSMSGDEQQFSQRRGSGFCGDHWIF